MALHRRRECRGFRGVRFCFWRVQPGDSRWHPNRRPNHLWNMHQDFRTRSLCIFELDYLCALSLRLFPLRRLYVWFSNGIHRNPPLHVGCGVEPPPHWSMEDVRCGRSVLCPWDWVSRSRIIPRRREAHRGHIRLSPDRRSPRLRRSITQCQPTLKTQPDIPFLTSLYINISPLKLMRVPTSVLLISCSAPPIPQPQPVSHTSAPEHLA